MNLESTVTASSNCVHDPSWYGALRLTERLKTPLPDAAPQGDLEDLVSHWRDQRPFNNSETFARWLAANALSEEKLNQVLGENLSSLKERFAEIPWWLDDFAAGWETDRHGSATQSTESETAAAALLAILAPLIETK